MQKIMTMSIIHLWLQRGHCLIEGHLSHLELECMPVKQELNESAHLQNANLLFKTKQKVMFSSCVTLAESCTALFFCF